MTSRRAIATALTGAAAVLLVSAGVWWLTSRDSDTDADASGTDGHAVTFTVIWDYSEIIRDCAEGDAHICMNRFEIPATATLSGDINGIGNQVLIWNEPVDFTGRAVDHIEHVAAYNVGATIEGCGEGRFLLLETPQFVSGANHDRDSGTYTGTWQIVSQSGRGGLQSLAGSGTSTGVFDTADDGRTFTGSVSCD